MGGAGWGFEVINANARDELSCQMPLSQGGDRWGVGGALTIAPQNIVIFYVYMKYDYVEKSNLGAQFQHQMQSKSPHLSPPRGGGGGGGGEGK